MTDPVINPTKGTYAGVKFDTPTTRQIHAYMKEHKIPNAIRADKLHTTLLFSRTHLPSYTPIGKFSEPILAHLGELEGWLTNGEGGSEKTNCLIVRLASPVLEARHRLLLAEHSGSHDWPIYQPHITLSYNIGDLNVSELPSIKKFIDCAYIVEEYATELDLHYVPSWNGKGYR